MKFLPKPIPDWRLAWRFASVQSALLLALLSGLQAEVLPVVAPLFPAHVWPWVSGGLALAVVVLRLVAQPALQPDRHAMAEPFYENREDFQRAQNHKARVEEFYKKNEDFRRDIKQMQAVRLRNANESSTSPPAGAWATTMQPVTFANSHESTSLGCSGSDSSSSDCSAGGSD